MERWHSWCSLRHFSPRGEWRGSRFDSPGWAVKLKQDSSQVRSTAQHDAHRHWVFAWCVDSHDVWLTQIWMDFAFTHFPTSLFAVLDKGLITPIPFQSNVVRLSLLLCLSSHIAVSLCTTMHMAAVVGWREKETTWSGVQQSMWARRHLFFALTFFRMWMDVTFNEGWVTQCTANTCDGTQKTFQRMFDNIQQSSR